MNTAETEASPARKDRPRNGRDTRFKVKNAFTRKGVLNRRTVLGQEAAKALEAGAWDVIERLLASSSWRARHEAAKTVLSYSLGMPRQMVHIDGGFSDLSRELTAALQEARLRRAALDVSMPTAGLLDAAEALPAAPGAEAPVLVAEVVRGATVEAVKPEVGADLLSTVAAANVEGTIQHSTTPEKGGNNQSNE